MQHAKLALFACALSTTQGLTFPRLGDFNVAKALRVPFLARDPARVYPPTKTGAFARDKAASKDVCSGTARAVCQFAVTAVIVAIIATLG